VGPGAALRSRSRVPSRITWLCPAVFAASSAPCSEGFRVASTVIASSR
jgi:hypothetical protein